MYQRKLLQIKWQLYLSLNASLILAILLLSRNKYDYDRVGEAST